jgi:transcriptional regulator of aromatic amino acid metabolism
LPPALGIIRSRTGNGRKLRSFNCDRTSSRRSSTPFLASLPDSGYRTQ